MNISKSDALTWFEFFSEIGDFSSLMPKQQEIAFAVLAQIEKAAESRFDLLRNEIPDLKSLNGRTYYVGPDDKFPAGCRSCLLGTGLSAVRKTNKCNARCKFCYDFGVLETIPPIGAGMWEIGGTKYREDDIEMLLNICNKPTGIAYVYLEPLIEIEKYYGMFEKFASAGIHQHLYTNGILITEDNVKAMRDSGLPELRFNLGATDASDAVIANIELAAKYIPHVGIETPMTREYWQAFHAKKDRILNSGIEFMNSAELHLNPNNAANYENENMYMYRHGYVSPIISRELTLRLMREASEENWNVVVHDCSNRTKFFRDLNLRAKEGGWFGSSAYGSEFDGIPFELFLNTLCDPDFVFESEEPLPEGYRIGDIAF